MPGSSRNERARYLNDYLQHLIELAEAGPDEVATAVSFLRQTFLPLGSAAWPWASAFGDTDIPAEAMQHFVSTRPSRPGTTRAAILDQALTTGSASPSAESRACRATGLQLRERADPRPAGGCAATRPTTAVVARRWAPAASRATTTGATRSARARSSTPLAAAAGVGLSAGARQRRSGHRAAPSVDQRRGARQWSSESARASKAPPFIAADGAAA